MENIFIPYKQASELKELGFDEPCIAYYTKTTERLSRVGSSKYSVDFETVNLKDIYHDYSLAPTFSQVFKWFRDNYKLHAEPVWDNDYYTYWFFSITKIGDVEFETIDLERFKTYEEAELACVDKLIELIKK
jgi:hypothetical protein